ncbi:MAG: hypothetical protein GY856_45630, partial [bacterium]|nr:hypothetical protein [bacterium]
IGEFFTEHRIEIHSDDARLAGAYLFEELAKHPLRFTTSAEATELRDRFQNHLRDAGTQRDFTSDLEELQDDFTNRYQLATAWIRVFLEQSSDDGIRKLAPSLDETVALLLTERRLDRAGSSALASLTVEVPSPAGRHRVPKQMRWAAGVALPALRPGDQDETCSPWTVLSTNEVLINSIERPFLSMGWLQFRPDHRAPCRALNPSTRPVPGGEGSPSWRRGCRPRSATA